MNNQFKNPTFGGFKPNAMQRIAGTLGYTGEMSGFNSYLEQNPDKKNQMDEFKKAAMMMAKGGAVRKFQTGGATGAGLDSFLLEGGYKPPENTGPPQLEFTDTVNPSMDQFNSSGGNVALNTDTVNPSIDQFNSSMKNTMNQFNTVQQNAAGTFDVVDSSGKVIKTNIDTQQQAQQMTGQQGGYDPSQGMPEPLGEDVVNQYTGDAPVHFNTELKQMFTSGNIPSDPTKYEITGKSGDWTITYADGTAIKNRAKNPASVENDAKNIIPQYINKFKESPEYTQNKNQQDAYRNFLSSGVTSGVTGDIENVEQEFNTTQSKYTQLQLELERLSNQAKANPDDPYLKELVETKGKEFSDTKLRLDQLTPLYQSTQKTISDVMTERATDPTLPEGARVDPKRIQQNQGQFIEAGSGQVSGDGGISEVALADTYLSSNVEQPNTSKYEADISTDKVAAATNALDSAQTDEDDPRSKVTAAATTSSMVGDLNAAQGTATIMENEVQREIQDGELISGAAADATKAAKFTEQIDAATATPSEKATVQGQLVGLMEQFEGKTPPAWAAGAVRLANERMAARGLGSSSIAGQAILQAAMEAALPIAQADATTQASFEKQNLSNRQARALLAAEQRATFIGQEFDQEFQSRVLNASTISDIANQNFTADQQVQLENSRMAQTMNLENLSNRQAMVLAEASALASLDIANLNNRQQTSVENAKNFLNLDLANLSNEQATEIFKTAQNIQSMLTDQAAINSSKQFNSQSENQANQFYDNLNSTINMHNTEQKNAQERFNTGEINAANQFNAEMKNNREQFNASNQLVVDQSNATWRREIATQDTAAINRANELNAINTLDISNTAYNNLWQLFGDQMEWAWTSAENQQDRINELAQEQLSVEERKLMLDAESSRSFGSLVSSLLFSDLSNTFTGSLFGLG
jgi:hypothetical protein